MDRRKVPILVFSHSEGSQTFISKSGNQPESGYKWVFKGALCALQWTMSSRGETKLPQWPFLTLKSTAVHKSFLRPFCSVLMMLKCCSIKVSHEGSLCVHTRMARHVSFWEPITLCIRLETCLRGETRFMEVESSSSPGWNPAWVCVMLCYVMGKRTHSHCSLISKVREGSEKTLCSARGFYWLILKANEIQEQGAHDEKHFWSVFIQQQ